MTQRTDKPKWQVNVTDLPKRRANITDLATRFGAAEVVPAPATGGSPVYWSAVREEVARRLRSTGGRPGLQDAEPRKVTLTDEEWNMVRELTDDIAKPGFHPSAGQVAGVLLGQAVRAARASMLEEAKCHVREITKTQY